MPDVFKKQFKVYFGDTDAAQVVHHARYLYWLEAARIDFLTHVGCSYKSLQDQQIGLVPINIHIKYLKPLIFDDTFEIAIKLINLTKTSLTINGDIIKDNTVHTTSDIKLACINEHNWKPQRLPVQLLEKLNK